MRIARRGRGFAVSSAVGDVVVRGDDDDDNDDVERGDVGRLYGLK